MSKKWQSLLGKKVIALRGYKLRRGAKASLDFILFDDTKTYLKLVRAVPTHHHERDASSRHVVVRVSPEMWARLFIDGVEDGHYVSFP